MAKTSKNTMFTGFLWSGIERISAQTLQFIIGIVLARLLTPKEYGLLGLIMVFIVISKVFIDSGFTKALIQKKDRNQNDICTVFYFNIAISLICYCILYFTAPFIAVFYNAPILTELLRVLALSLVLNAFFAVPSTLFSIDLNFKTISKVTITSVVTSGAVAIFLAYSGYGVWALVWQTLIKSTISVLGMWYLTKWKPNFIFSIPSFKQMYAYGSKLLFSSLLAQSSSKLNDLLIGKYIGASDLGLFSRGIQFADFISVIFNSTMNNVLLPALTPFQNQIGVLIKETKKVIKTSALLIVPLFFGLAAIAEPLVLFLLTDKWIMAVPIMQLFCIARLITILSNININLLYIIGKTDLVLKQQYVKIAVRVVLLLSALKFGIFYIAMAELLTTAIHFFINSYFPGKIMKFGAFHQIKEIAPIIFAGILMVIPILGIHLLFEDNLTKILLSLFVAAPTYIGLLKIFKVKELNDLVAKTKKMISK